MILALIDEAVAAGARQSSVCEVLEIHPRTVQRWRQPGGDQDRRKGPNTTPANKLSDQERARTLEIANSPEFRDLSPKQIVPKLASRGEYHASESTFYRIFQHEGQLKHREPSRPATRRHKPAELVATGPNETWSWDITYLKSAVLGSFFYLYMVVDIWSRKIVAWEVHEEESAENAARLLAQAYRHEGVSPGSLTLHSDNGSPMKAATMLAALQRLGVATSFSRPSVSNDNPFSESLFRTMKYRPGYPSGAFGSIEEARAWVSAFVAWYNTEHLHCGIRFVTPDDRHSGRDLEHLERRQEVYQEARERHPERWSGNTRNWNPITEVVLNPNQVAITKTG